MTKKELLKTIGLTSTEYKNLDKKTQNKLNRIQQDIHNTKAQLSSPAKTKAQKEEALKLYQRRQRELENFKKNWKKPEDYNDVFQKMLDELSLIKEETKTEKITIQDIKDNINEGAAEENVVEIKQEVKEKMKEEKQDNEVSMEILDDGKIKISLTVSPDVKSIKLNFSI